MKKFEADAKGLTELESFELVDVNGGVFLNPIYVVFAFGNSMINGLIDGWNFDK